MTSVSNRTDEQKKVDSVEDAEHEFIRKVGWKALFGFTTKQHLPVLSIAFFTATVSALTLPAMAVLYGLMFRQFAEFGSGKIAGDVLLRNISKYCIYLTGVVSLNWLSNSIYFAMFLTFGELQARSARDRMFNALIQKDMAWYDTRQSGVAAFLPAIQMQIRDLQLSVSGPFGEGLQCIVQAIGALAVAFYFAWNLTLVIIASVPLIYIVMALLSKRFTARAHEQADKLQQALKYVTNAIQSIETVKCFNGERLELQRYIGFIGLAAALYVRQANIRSLQVGFMQFITLSIFVQGFWYGSHLVTSGQKNAGDVVTTFWGALMAVQGISGFLPQFITLQKGRVAGARLQALMAQMSKNDLGTELRGKLRPDRCPGDVVFKKVTFAYPTRSDQPAIRDVSVFFPAGETTFVIGRSGSGKSTLGQLLVRFYQANAGEIFLDGVGLEQLDVQWLRENITLVEQHSVLFNDTIRRNVELARQGQNVGREEVEEAVKFALLQQMVQELPDGLDTLVGMKGDAMSGGQLQRMALARARLRDTPVLVLDESTSALDYITRSAILEAIRTWRRGKTTIVITHDVSQIGPDDFVYVLDNARVVQEGYRKVLEAEPNSIWQTFLASQEDDMDAEDKEEDEDDDGTEEILSLYAGSWGMRTPPRPTSALFFNEQLLSPILSPGRNSMLVTGGRRLSIPTSESDASDGNLKPPALPASVMRSHEARSFQSRPLSMVSNRRVSRNISYPRPISVTQEVPLRLDLPAIKQRRQRCSANRKSKDITPDNPAHPPTPEPLSLREIIGTVWPTLTWRYRLILIGAFMCAFTHAGATPTFGFVFARLLSTFYVGTDQKHLALTYALSILGIAIADGLATYGFHFLFDVCAQAWVSILKEQAMRRILMQPREFFDREENSVSRIAECLDQFAEEARNLPGRFAGIVVVIVTMIIIAIIWSLITCWKLTLVALGCGPVLYAITWCYNKISSRWETLCNEADENVGQVLHETFANIRTVRCLVLEEVFRKKHKKATTTALKIGMKRALYSGSIFGLNYAGVLFVTALFFWYGAFVLSRGEFSTTRILQAFAILLLSVNHTNYIGNYMPQINTARDAGSRLLRLARLPQNSHELGGTVQIQSAGDVVFEGVSFTYPTRKENPVLHSVSFNIARGSCTAIVGSSGSGKSTIAALLLKLYQTDSRGLAAGRGDLSISGHNIKTLHTAMLRSRMAIVSQSPVLFPGTIADNIAYGLSPSSSRATLESIRRAASAAGVADFIASLPQGYQTLLGEGGTSLSGGQAQRIAISRALVRDPDILILDEATSALDVESGGVVRETIQRLVMEKGRHMTVIIITHAREMMSIAEHIIMLDKGRVVEEGSFDELKRKRGQFSRLLRGDAEGL
ncbi:multidrug resistance protein-like protein 2 [Massariosphaeria phaeospora]|uniref:Multidrug resistance protein-like protein 2 n=1 Tax=Massariosphaeria phaeospora TaxID=100035 RepID=A0A7C8M2E4_9PLEO|nr:multidrug resistance protein-like protein 2 [Massariosphaeria phaeospora]